MFFQRFYDTKLAQASYLIGCQMTGESVVVDPNRDVQQYLDAAEREGFRITHVTETHIHADFVSGARELALRADARLLLSDEGDENWKYAYARESGATLLKDNDHFMVGNIRIEAMHTPGHTPEHLSFLVSDTVAGAGPWGILTGDFVFVGDVGRPDLLERAAGYVGTMEAAARTLYRSLERFRALPDHLQVWPGHGAGSACGKALGALASTTVGYEKLANWGVGATNESEFVRMVLEGQPEAPRYFATMKRINKEGPALLRGMPRVTRPARSLDDLLREGEVVIDTRPGATYATGHVPGTLNIPLDNNFTTWAGWLLPYDRPVYLIVDGARCDGCASAALHDLAMIGIDRIGGVFGVDAIDAWASRPGNVLGTVAERTPREIAEMREQGGVALIDVRGRTEWEAGHLPGAKNVPLGLLSGRLSELPAGKPVIVHCQAGSRSAIAASVLQAHGVQNVVNMVGGYAAWRRMGLPVSTDSQDEAHAAVPALSA